MEFLNDLLVHWHRRLLLSNICHCNKFRRAFAVALRRITTKSANSHFSRNVPLAHATWSIRTSSTHKKMSTLALTQSSEWIIAARNSHNASMIATLSTVALSFPYKSNLSLSAIVEHFPLNVPSNYVTFTALRASGTFRIITILRDPLQQFLSYYKMVKTMG